MNIPQHVAIIMDGNGRWAKKRLLPRTAGHEKGAEVAKNIAEIAKNRGVKFLTLYAFSTENWKRPASEVDAIMNLLRHYVAELEKQSNENDRILILGDKSRLDKSLQDRLISIEEKTKNNTNFTLAIAINYGAREELCRAFKQMKEENVEFSESEVDKHLFTSSMPDVDLLIRPGGEKRISNFLLWQCSYAEFVFQDTFWPDYGAKEFDEALAEFDNRQRRYGAV